MSQASASSQPPPSANPFTAAMTTLGDVIIRWKTSVPSHEPAPRLHLDFPHVLAGAGHEGLDRIRS